MKRLSPFLLMMMLLLCACGTDSDAKNPSSTPSPDSASGPAETEDTRPSYEVYWFVNDQDMKTIVKEGDTPVPPPEATQTITTESQILTFTGWDKEPEPLTAEYVKNNRLIFRAQYTSEKRVFTVRYMADGKEVYSANGNYGDIVPCPVDPPQKDGYSGVIWPDVEEPISGDTIREALYTFYNAEQLLWAYKTDLLSFSDEPGSNDAYHAVGVLEESAAVLYMLMEVRESPDGVWTPKFTDRIVESLKYMVGENGVAPLFTLEPNWCYNTLTAAIAVAKDTPAVWDKLSAAEKEKYDFIMETFAHILTFGTADVNHYYTGPGLRGNYGKERNPNYRLAVVTPMLFVGNYFGGADKVNAILADFSYDKTIAKFKEYGFERAYAEWTVPVPTKDGVKTPSQKQVMENGGPIYRPVVNEDGTTSVVNSGNGEGVRVAYTYNDYTVDEIAGIYNNLLTFNFSGGAIVSQYGKNDDGTYKSYIIDGTKSPYEGQQGMMLEFAGTDSGGIRSSFSYCSEDFVLVCAALAAMEELDMYNLKEDADEELYNMVWFGMMDTIYKGEHGYRSYSMGRGHDTIESTGKGYMLWKNWWLNWETVKDGPLENADDNNKGDAGEDAVEDNLLTLDFDDIAEGAFTKTDDGKIYANKKSGQIAVVMFRDSKVLKIHQTENSKDPYVDLLPTTAPDNVTKHGGDTQLILEYDLYFEETSENMVWNLGLSKETNNGKTAWCYSALVKGKDLGLYKSFDAKEPFMNLELKKWYKVAVALDTEKDVYSVYLDNQPVIENAPYIPDTDVEYSSQFRISFTQAAEGNTTAYVDNIKIYNGSVPRDADDGCSHTASAWKTNNTEHWKICTAADCGAEIANTRGAHTDTNNDNKCDSCGYDMTPAVAETSTETNLLALDFEDITEGNFTGTTDGLTTANRKSGQIAVVKFDDSKVLKIHQTESSKDPYVDLLPTTAPDNVNTKYGGGTQLILEYDLYFEETSENMVWNLGLSKETNNSKTAWCYSALVKGKDLGLYKSFDAKEPFMNLELKKWYKIAVALDTEKDVYSVYLDNQPVIENAPYIPDTDVEYSSQFRISFVQAAEGNTTAYMDNIKIYNGAAPREG